MSSLKMQFIFKIQHEYLKGIPGIHQVYTYLTYHVFCLHLVSLPGLQSAPGYLRPGLSADLSRWLLKVLQL